MASKEHRKRFIPLESNPTVFTELAHNLGLSSSLGFSDVLSLEEPDLLAMVPRPVLALVLVFPTLEKYEKARAEAEAKRSDYTGSGSEEPVIWYKQTIHNACGFYGMLHAITNGDAKDYLVPDSIIGKLVEKGIPLTPKARARTLEDSEELEATYKVAANKGDSSVPSIEEEVDYHYICFVKSKKTGQLYELDGAKRGPIDLGPVLLEGDDLLSEASLKFVKDYIDREQGDNIGFSLMALGPITD